MKKLLHVFDKFGLKFGVLGTLIFTLLYPKLPSIYITHTWVYVRAEDFVIALITFLWIVQLLRKKATIALPLGWSIGAYWLAAFISLIFSILFIGPHLANYFPKVAVLEYFRRIEYMILFFVAFSTVKSVKDIRDYVIALLLALVGVVAYGIGQHFYLSIWNIFPSFFEKYPFCFPSFQTGNEEFAKGIPLCLPFDARVASTFGGHYDLAAFLVIALPVILSVFLVVKKTLYKMELFLLFLASVMLLIFTASRVSFVAYLFGTISMLIILGRKKLIIPVVMVSVIILLAFSQSLANRFLQTFRFTTVVTNSQGQIVGVAPNTLPADLQKKIAKNPVDVANVVSQALPEGSGFLTLPQDNQIATSVAVIKSSLSQKEAERLQLANGGLQISQVSGNFLMKQALVYDISFTTRFQAEWPRDIAAFTSYPLLGQGIGTLTLASDNDYFRALGETGALGFITFLGIFFAFGIFLKEALPHISDKFVRYIAVGLAGGVLGLFFNATLIDVFEASKVAEPLWISLGIVVAGVSLFAQKVPYKKDFKAIFISTPFIIAYLCVVCVMVFGQGLGNFFIADDFTWLHWAASATPHSLVSNFYNAQGFFYRPLDKLVVFILNTFFAFQPFGYHLFTVITHLIMSVGVYLLVKRIVRKKSWAFVAALLFVLLPVHGEDLFWFSALSTNLASIFMLFGLVTYMTYRLKNSLYSYITSIVLAILALLSYEMAAVLPLLLVAADWLILPHGNTKKILLGYIPFIILLFGYFVIHHISGAAGFSGDYSYSALHFIPNFFGNLLGYFAIFVGGNAAIPWYEVLRTGLRTHALIVLLMLVAGIISLLVAGFIQRWHTYFRSELAKKIIFSILFVIISLLPFLGLGNITERYAYLASVGFVLLVVSIGQFIFVRIKNRQVRIVTSTIIAAIFLVFSLSLISKENSEWHAAGILTRNTLGYFRIEKDDLPKGATLYMVNVPIRQANAWIFPVGLSDGLWFVYRDDRLDIQEVATITEARMLKVALPPIKQSTAYIFAFDNNKNISEVK